MYVYMGFVTSLQLQGSLFCFCLDAVGLFFEVL